eukprot:5607052-Pyramimonas_sp.AAC.1
MALNGIKQPNTVSNGPLGALAGDIYGWNVFNCLNSKIREGASLLRMRGHTDIVTDLAALPLLKAVIR